jgi:hypothetical protein
LKKPPSSPLFDGLVGAVVEFELVFELVFDDVAPDARAVTPVTWPATNAVSTPNAMTEPAISADFSFFVIASASSLGMRAARAG